MERLRIVNFTVTCSVAKPLIKSEVKGDLVMRQTLPLFKCKFLYHAIQTLVPITILSASVYIKNLATKCTTVKWPIVQSFKTHAQRYCFAQQIAC